MPKRRRQTKEEIDYKLLYFDGRGLAEVSRLLFTIAGVKFEDVRVPYDGKTFQDEYKEKCVFQKVPQLTYNGTLEIAQSKAIERFLAKNFKLFGKNQAEAAQIDAFSEQIRDFVLSYNQAKGDDAKLEKYWNETLPTLMEHTARAAGKDGHLVGNAVSLADVQFYFLTSTFFSDLSKLNPVLEKYENLVKVRDTIANNPKIVEYVSKRPASDW